MSNYKTASMSTNDLHEYLQAYTCGQIGIESNDLNKNKKGNETAVFFDQVFVRPGVCQKRLVKKEVGNVVHCADRAAQEFRRGNRVETGFGIRSSGELFGGVDKSYNDFLREKTNSLPLFDPVAIKKAENAESHVFRYLPDTDKREQTKAGLDGSHLLVEYNGRSKDSVFYCTKEKKFYLTKIENYDGTRNKTAKVDVGTMHCPACSTVGFKPMSARAFIGRPDERWIKNLRKDYGINCASDAEPAVCTTKVDSSPDLIENEAKYFNVMETIAEVIVKNKMLRIGKSMMAIENGKLVYA